MIYKICYVIAQVLLYFAILEWITYRTVQKNKYCRRICSGTLMLLEGILTTITDNISNGGEVAFIFLCILGLFTYLFLTDSKNNLLYNFSMVISAVTIEVIYLIILTIPCSYLCLWLSGENNIFLVREIFTIADLVVSFCIFFFGKKIPLYKLFEIKGIRIISTVVGIISIVLQQVGLQLVKSNRGKVNILIANFLIFTIIIGILWLLDHYRLAAGKLKVEQDNRRMNTSLHKTKELMPLLISVVNENEGLLDPQLVEEFDQIYSEQMIAGRKDSMNYKLLGTTGIKLLDAQLQHYILECNKKGIVMDVFASEPIAKQMLKIHQYAIMSAPTLSQYAAIVALRECDKEVQKMVDEYNRRRRMLVDGFNRIGLTCFNPEGAFYMFPCIRSIGMSSEEFCETLLQEEKVAVVPGNAVGESGEGFVRVSYAYSLKHLQEALVRIERFVNRHRGE